ncbi:MAG: LamG domain-containing protein, partial [Verrucomicrobiae bacterium]|nr:LamG domain-containing protein [Verrucomicrobiae bacterium]
MRFRILRLLPLWLMFSVSQAGTLMETWETGYTGADATGPHIAGYWKFDGESPEQALRDISGKGHDLKLEGGGAWNPKGRSGGALESFPGFPIQDKRHAAATPSKADLSFTGAFTMEMWIAPKPEFEDRLRCYLLDKKYVDHTDYQWQLGDADKGGLRRMWVTIGFGSESRTFYSDPARYEPGVWHHVAFTYDGAGEGRFFIDGQTAGRQHHDGVAGPVPGTKPLSIGDRLGSNYGGFPGLIDEVRLCRGVLAFEPVALTIASPRTVWQRMEKAEPIEVSCVNLRREPLKGATLRLSWSGGGAVKTIPLPELASGATHVERFPVDTSLRPEEYRFTARLELTQPKVLSTEREARFSLMARLPERMPVIMWGVGIGSVEKEADRLRDLGFTHCLGMGADYGAIWKADGEVMPEAPEKVAENTRLLDVALRHDLELVTSLSPGRWLESDPANHRVGRDGKPYPRQDICASTPEFAPFFQRVGASVSKAYGTHPAFSMGLVNTEVRDASAPSFNAGDVERYRAFSGGEIPPEVASRSGVEWQKLKDFPADRVVPDDHPIL